MLPSTKLERLPRMADFALWTTACEAALWPAGTFWSAYCGNRDEAVEGVIEVDPVAMAIRGVMSARTEWAGTATELLAALADVVGDRVVRSRSWPDSPRALSGRLRRAATFLRKIGIEIGFEREGRARNRIIHITATETPPAAETRGPQSSASSAWNAHSTNTKVTNGFAAPLERTVADGADYELAGEGATDRTNRLDSNHKTDADDADANSPPRQPRANGAIGMSNHNALRAPPDRCAGCGGNGHAQDPLVPFGTESVGHAWLHRHCWPAWHRAREAVATETSDG